MNKIEQEVQENISINWAEIKSILNGIEAALASVDAMLPAGLAKTIIAGVAGAINVVISALPN